MARYTLASNVEYTSFLCVTFKTNLLRLVKGAIEKQL